MLPAPAAPLVAVEKAPPAPLVAVEKAPAAPEVAVEKAPAAPEVAVSKTPPPKEVTVEAAPPAPEVTNLKEVRRRVSDQSPLRKRRKSLPRSCNALVSGHGSAGNFGEDAAATARDDTADSNVSSSIHRAQGKRSRTQRVDARENGSQRLAKADDGARRIAKDTGCSRSDRASETGNVADDRGEVTVV